MPPDACNLQTLDDVLQYYQKENWDGIFQKVEQEYDGEVPDEVPEMFDDEKWNAVFAEMEKNRTSIGAAVADPLDGVEIKDGEEIKIPAEVHARLNSPDFLAKLKEVENKFGDVLTNGFKYIIVDFILTLDHSRYGTPIQAWSLFGGYGVWKGVNDFTNQRREELIYQAMERVDAGKGSWFTDIIVAANDLDKSGIRDLAGIKTSKSESNRKVYMEAGLDSNYQALLQLSPDDDKTKIDETLKNYIAQENQRIEKMREDNRLTDKQYEEKLQAEMTKVNRKKKYNNAVENLKLGRLPKVYFSNAFNLGRTTTGKFMEKINKMGPDYTKIMDLLGKIPVDKTFDFNVIRQHIESTVRKVFGVKKSSTTYSFFNHIISKVWFMMGPALEYAKLIFDTLTKAETNGNKFMLQFSAAYGDFYGVYFTAMNSFIIFFYFEGLVLVIGVIMKILFIIIRVILWAIQKIAV